MPSFQGAQRVTAGRRLRHPIRRTLSSHTLRVPFAIGTLPAGGTLTTTSTHVSPAGEGPKVEGAPFSPPHLCLRNHERGLQTCSNVRVPYVGEFSPTMPRFIFWAGTVVRAEGPRTHLSVATALPVKPLTRGTLARTPPAAPQSLTQPRAGRRQGFGRRTPTRTSGCCAGGRRAWRQLRASVSRGQ